MGNPYEQEYPEGVFDEFTIVVRLDRETGNYMVSCREWKCEFAGGKCPDEAVRRLVYEIAKHNEYEMGV